MTIGDLFHSDPTRQLEEVQKVNARERAETDVREFYETDSSERVLEELGDTIQTHPGEAARFLYIHATFGSGKTHLLKLVGLVTDDDSDLSYLGDRLAEQWPGFDELQRSIADSHVDRLKPVFLNLLDRDASREPPLPFLIFEAIGRELGYPTDPNWLLEWAWRLDTEYDGVWDALRAFEHDGKTFENVLDERASLRSWLYEALPAMPETTGTDLDARSEVKASIETAEGDVEPEAFGPETLVSRVETVTEALNDVSSRTELLLGLDEVALFVGDSRHRYREFEETMEALQRGSNPVVVTTGQYSLSDTRESLIGEPPEEHWTHQQVPLEGADTEIIVRKRWLQKSDERKRRVESLVASTPDLSLDAYSLVTSADPDPVESYPFREYDLSLLRAVMQELITQGRSTDRDYIQGRALLVLVRSLFTKFGWASKEEGSLVTWDVLFDLLVEETTYLPLWVQEMIDNTLVPTFDGDEDAWEVRLAKGLYLLNQASAVPSTPENLGRLMVDDVTASVDDVVERTESGLERLVNKQKVLTETNDEGDEVYTLVSEEQESVLSRAQDKAAKISPHQLSAWLRTRLRENDDFFRSDGTRHEVDVGDERLVPLRYDYSILEPVDRAPSPEYDALRVRVLADDPETVSEQVETWQDINDGRDGGEHVLITIDVPETMLERIQNVIGMGQVLNEETESHEELEREHRADKRRLESSVTEILEDASVHTVHERRGSRSSVLDDVVAEQVDTAFGSSRKTLSQPLVEVDDAKAMAQFFRSSGEWPLSNADAAMLGVGTTSAEIAEDGWCREFIDTYESQRSVDVETLLQQTRTASGDYRGTPQESIAALLITLATSNESVTLKQDTEYVTDPAAIGRQVRTKGGLTSIQVRFGVVDVVDAKTVKELVATVLSREPTGDGPDEWLSELGQWVGENSTTVKRALKGANREFDVALASFEATVDPALSGEELSTSALGGEDDLETVLEEARTFAHARELFGVEEDGPTLWERFGGELNTMASLYPNASITASMRATAESDTVPSVATVESRIQNAEEHRVDEVSALYRYVTGDTVTASDPDGICDDLSAWLRSNENDVRGVLDQATEEFDGVVLDEFEELLGTAWNGEGVSESDVVDPTVVQQAETYEQVRELFDSTGGASLWSQLQEVGQELRDGHPDSPTTDAVETALASPRPPTERHVRQLLERAKDPKPPGADDDAWAELQTVAERLRQELPNASVTDEATAVVDADERPSEERVTELLTEGKTALGRIQSVKDRLDRLEDGSIVLIED